MKIFRIDQLDESYFQSKTFSDLPEVGQILSEVVAGKDEAVRRFTLQFDNARLDDFRVDKKEMQEAYELVDEALIRCIETSAERVRRFAEKQLKSYRHFEEEIEEGVLVGQQIFPIDRVGVYVPGGRFPLISSVYMGAIPAKVAGVSEVIVCSPPTYRGSIHPAVLVAADVSGVDEIYKIGGVQAVGAMAYGTESIKKVCKIVGPGNAYVTAAKKYVYGTVGIDFIAGPTEILIIADEHANPSFIAADLIAQAEHDVDASPILVTDSRELSDRVLSEIETQLESLITANVAKVSLDKNGLIVLVDSLEQAMEFANSRAPEHLELALKDADTYVPKLRNYGSLFIGQRAAEVLGDYSSGLNHVLPTNAAACYTGGLSVGDFLKIQSTLRVTDRGLAQIGHGAQKLAEAEGLAGHANSVRMRMETLAS